MVNVLPLTDEERAFAETNIALVDRFLRVKRLAADEYWDIAIMGYLEAVQTYHRKPIAEDRRNFPALANTCMKHSVYKHWRHENCQMRRGETISLDYIASSTETDDFSLYAVLADEKQDVTRLVEGRELLEYAHARGSYRELEVMDLIADGYDVMEAAQLLCVSIRKCQSLLRSIRMKTTSAKAEYRNENQKRMPRKYAHYKNGW